MKRILGTAGALCLLPLATGCEVAGTDSGELGNGAFSYVCAGDADAWCETPFRHGGRPLPALEAPFSVTFRDTEIGAAEVIAAAPARIAFSRGRFACLVPGPAALLARDGRGVVRDFFHLQGAPVAGLELVHVEPAQLGGVAPKQQLDVDPWALEPVDAVALAAGARAVLFGYPVGADGEVLTGSPDWRFTVEPAGVVALHVHAGDNVVEIEALAEGTATLRATAARAVRDLPIRVEVGP